MLTWWWWPNQRRKAEMCSYLFDTPHNKYLVVFDFYNITLWYLLFSLHFTLSSECGVETNWLVLLREIVAVCCGNCRKHISADFVAICCFTGILADVLYGCGICSLTLREECRLRVCKNRVLGEYLGLRGTWWEGGGENYITRNLMICTA